MMTDIAIIGMAGRFPNARTMDDLYQHLKAGTDSLRPISPERLASTTLDPSGTYCVRGYMDGIDAFDHALFGIVMGEAQTMDPHQRQLLEVAYEAIENAGYNVDELNGSDTAVFVADTVLRYLEHADEFVPTLLTGNVKEFVASRISRSFNFLGGACMFDTSCSSSLVALHHACNELILGNCEQAIVGAANLELFPIKNEYDFDVASPDGKSRPFSAQANGMSYGEVVGCLLLKRLDRALADQDNIQAVIKSTAVNNNAARSASMTAPDSAAQAAVIQRAWQKAGVSPDDIGFIEAHGSGTQLGDSIEVGGLNLAFSAYPARSQPCPVSSIKANVGHARMAAGMAGLFKTVLALKHGELFPAVNFNEPSKLIDFDKSAVRVNETWRPWPTADGKPRIAALSSMGLSGTNGHAVLQEAPRRAATRPAAGLTTYLIPVSSKTPAGLTRNLAALSRSLDRYTDADLTDISFTLTTGRKHYPYRVALRVNDLQDLKRQLAGLHPPTTGPAPRKVILILSENGKLTDNTIEAFNQYSAFRQPYEACLALGGEAAPPVMLENFAFQYAFAQMLAAFGIEKDAVLGVGLGKVVIDVLNGRITLGQGVAQLQQQPASLPDDLAERVNKLVSQQTEPVLFLSALPCCPILTRLQVHPLVGKAFETLRPNADLSDPASLILGYFYQTGSAIAWKSVWAGRPGGRMALPTYQFEKTRCWLRESPRVNTPTPQTTAVGTAKPAPILTDKDATGTEKMLATLWADVLPDAVSFGRTDNFFRAGGNSLRATKVINRINQQFGIRLDFEDIFDFPELGQLATYIDGLSTTTDKVIGYWKDVLKLDRINPEDNFFELGGHSLMASQVLNRVNQAFGIGMNFEDFFENGTVTELANLIDKKRQTPLLTTALVRAEAGQAHYPVSGAQRRIWILDQLQPGGTVYNNAVSFVLEGPLNQPLLQRAFAAVVERHENLRTTFLNVDGEPKQVIHPVAASPFVLTLHDLSGTEDQQARTLGLASAQNNQPFDLAVGPLLRGSLVRHTADRHVLLLTIHHIVSDEWSMHLLFNELVLLYNGYQTDSPAYVPTLPIQYKDFAVWQEQERQAGKLDEARQYWHDRFSGEIPVLEFPIDHPRPTVRTYQGRTITKTMSAEWLHQLRTFSDEQSSTLFMTLLAGLNALLYRYTGQTDLVIGSPVAGRTHQDVEHLIGVFINTVALRTSVSPDESFADLLQKVRKNTPADLSHQQYPFDQLLTELPIPRDTTRSPLFDVFLNVKNMSAVAEDQAAMGLTLKPFRVDVPTSKFDISLLVTIHGAGLQLANLFSAERMERMLAHFEQLLDQACVRPTAPIGQLNLLTAPERAELLAVNQTDYPFPQDETLVSLIEQQAQRTPHAIALRQNDQTWTYAQLDAWGNRIAHYLLDVADVQPGQRVGLLLERSGWQVASLLGVLKTGCAYVPLDVQFPPERIAYQLSDAGVKVVLVDQAGTLALRGLTNLIEITPGQVERAAPSAQPVEVMVLADQTAYVIYTSGSTGRPKGVALGHRGVVNRLLWMGRMYGFDAQEVVLQKTPYVFDVSVWEFFLPLLSGGQLVLCRQTDIYNPTALVGLIDKYRITTLHFVPGMFQVFLESLTGTLVNRLGSLRQVFTSGEALSAVSVTEHHRQLPAVALHNLYGPTEASVDVSYYETKGHESIIPIGRPIDNTQLWIVDAGLQLQPKGVWGEIWIGGVGVAQGYVGQPELTADRFRTEASLGGRLYRSGDRGRWTEAGEIEYGGRLDNQVKVRGYRIELGEIERAVAEVPGVEQGIVLVRESGMERSLVCFYSSRQSRPLSFDEWQVSLGAVLPGYMLPTEYQCIDQWPVTATGKIDRKALLSLNLPSGEADGQPETAPETRELQATVLAAFETVLARKPVKLTDSFFQIGGDSIKAIRLINALNKSLSARLEVKDIYQHQEAQAFIAYVSQQQHKQVLSLELDEASRQIDRVKDDILADPSQARMLPADYEDVYPMSAIETGMVYHNLLDEGQGVYHDQFVYQFADASFDLAVFRAAFSLLVRKHTNLRCSLRLGQFQQPIKLVHRFAPDQVSVPYHDLRLYAPSEQQTFLTDYLTADRAQPFDLQTPGLFRLSVCRLSTSQYEILWSYHHAILDGWSYASLFTELSQVYFKRKQDREFLPDPIAVTYRDFIVDQQRVTNAPAVAAYWKTYLEEVVPGSLPLGRTGQPETFRSSLVHTYLLDETVTEQVRQTAYQQKVLASSVFLTAFCALLGAATEVDEITLGRVTQARPEIDGSEQILGCFLNTVPLRITTRGHLSGGELLTAVHAQLTTQKSYEKLPLADILKATPNESVFSAYYTYVDMHVYQDMHEELISQQAAVDGLQNTNALFDFMINQTGGQTRIIMRGHPDLYSPQDMSLLKKQYDHMLQQLIHAPAEPLLTDTKPVPAKNDTYVSLFEANLARYLSKTALCFEGRTLTYADLNEQANRIARRLRTQYGVRPDDVVALLMPKSDWAIISILGVLKSGAAYLPIDPAYPTNLIDHIITDGKPAVVLTISTLADALPPAAAALPGWVVDRVSTDGPVPMATQNLPVCSQGTDLAYIIYTSGSTGMPKGVEIENRNLVHYITWANEYYYNNATGSDFGLFTSLSFDLTVTGIFATLLRGDTLFVYDDEDLGETLQTVFQDNTSIRSVKLTPSHIRLLGHLNIAQTAVSHIIVGGEALLPYHVDVLRNMNPAIQIDNEYGPTETTVGCTIERVADANRITIGKPIANTTIHILTEALQPVPAGDEGELYIGGSGLARGYRNRPDLTNQRFILNPANPDQRLYRTGDVAAWLPDGNIQLLGRKDEQVKVKGYRIELDGIETVMRNFDGIDAVAVVFHAPATQLVAFYQSASVFSPQVLKTYAARHLPDYMIPQQWVQVAVIPLTTNGKTDKKALISRWTNVPGATGQPVAAAPEQPVPVEQLLSETFASIFGQSIGLDDDYWVLNIDSIRAVQISARLRDKGYKVQIRQILQARTLAGLARQVTRIPNGAVGQPVAQPVAVGIPRLSNSELNSLFD
jgi:amino acid adenylation domain-containing protein